MEVLTALQHAELHLGREFTKDEFVQGQVGQFMIPEDFDPKITVSYFKLSSSLTHLMTFSPQDVFLTHRWFYLQSIPQFIRAHKNTSSFKRFNLPSVIRGFYYALPAN